MKNINILPIIAGTLLFVTGHILQTSPVKTLFGLVFHAICLPLLAWLIFRFLKGWTDWYPFRVYLWTFLSCAWIFFIAAALHRILWFSYASDEAEKFALGYFAANGLRIYRDVFDHHGPFCVMISHFFYSLVPVNEIPIARLPGLLLFLLPAGCFFIGTFLRTKQEKLTAVFFYLTLLGCLYGVTDYGVWTYQAVGGIFIGCAFFFLLPLLRNDTPLRHELFLCGFFLAFTMFTAVSFGIAFLLTAFFLIFSFFCDRKNTEKYRTFMVWLLGGSAGTGIMLFYLIFFSDLRCFWEQHIVFNFKFYSRFVSEISSFAAFSSLKSFWDEPLKSIGCVSMIFMLLACLVLHFGWTPRRLQEKAILLFKIFLIFMTFLFCSPRGIVSFHGKGSFFFALILLAAILGFFRERNWFHKIGVGVLLFSSLIFLREYANKLFRNTEFPQPDYQVQLLTKPNDRVLFYPYHPSGYFFSHRLPASCHQFYLPWTEAYINENPKAVNVIRELENQREKRFLVCIYENGIIFKRYFWNRDFGKDLHRVLSEHCIRVQGSTPGTGIYLSQKLFSDLKKEKQQIPNLY